MGYGQAFRSDGYVNMINKVGTSKDPLEGYQYQPETATPDIELAQVYNTNGIFTRIIDKPAELAVKNGYDYGIGDADLVKDIENTLSELKWKDTAAAALKWSRLFGGSVVLIGADDGGDWDEPVDLSAIQKVANLVVFERPEVQPDYNSVVNRVIDYSNVDRFDRPEYYFITPMYGGSQIRVHESRLLIFRNGRLPRTGSMSTEYMFFGAPEYDRIKRELRNTITAHGNGYRLLERCVQAVYKMKNLAAIMATEDGEDDVIRRMQLIDMARSLLNTMVIDADGEDLAFQTFQLGGVKDIIDESCNMLSAVTNIPQTVLFGRSPAGENATGEGDLTNYYDYVGQIQELCIRDNLQYLLRLILTSYLNTGKISEVPQMQLEANPLWNQSDKEKAELESQKASAQLTKAQATQIYVDMQVLDPKEVRRSLAKTDEYQIDEVLSEEDLDPDLSLEAILSQMGKSESEAVTTEQNEQQNDSAMEPGGAAVIVIHDGRILCGRRSDDGTICGPGGHAEQGETQEQAAVRETQEEFSITPHNLYHIGAYEGSPPLYLPSNVYLSNTYTGDVQTDDQEMSNAQWLSLEELAEEKLFPPFAAGIKMMLEALTGDKRHDNMMEADGGEGSGNFGHEGRPGQIGGSGDSGGSSAAGSNHLSVRGFKNKQHLNNHWQNGRSHHAEYAADGITTAKQYEKRAVELAENPVGGSIKGYKTKEGYICRYDVEKNDYVKADPQKGIRTMFKPESGIEYFQEMLRREGIESDE